ncbi:MAG: hypothetical protein LBT56_05780 [Prevotellaceae bacterium]|jgi:putative lipase involved disintegration of autophagic bodies|nr:hypothetical protein [Prevotellaceae bacterium]
MKKIIILVLLLSSFSIAAQTETQEEKLKREIQELEQELKELEDCASSQQDKKEFNFEAMKSKRKTLSEEAKELLKQCSQTGCPQKVSIRLNEINREIDILDKRIESKAEWLNRIKNMSDNDLEYQEKVYSTFTDMAGMAQYSYKDSDAIEAGLPEGWNEVDRNVSPTLSSIIDKANDNDYGFQCALLYKDGKYVLAFRGTEFDRELLKDVKSDAKGAVTNLDKQTQAALEITRKLILDGKINTDDIQLTGHSLGGRLAAEAAVTHGLTAYTFNAAGVSAETNKVIAETNYNNTYKGQVINVSSANDFLTGLQNTVSSLTANEYVNNDFINNPIINNEYVKEKIAETAGYVGKALGGVVGGVVAEKTAEGVLFMQGKDFRTTGGVNVIREAYGENIKESHSIKFIKTALAQRYQDVENTLSQRKNKNQ